MSDTIFDIVGELSVRGMDAAERGLDRVENQAAGLTGTINNLGERSKRTGDRMTKFATGPIAGVAGALGGLARSAANTGEEIRDNARQAGMTTDAYQELEFALGQIGGVSDDQVSRALGRLNQRVGEAKAGNDNYIESLEAIGVSYEDLQDSSFDTEDAFDAFIDAMAGAESATEASQIAGDLFGTRLGRDLGPALMEAGDDVDALRERAHELGIVMGEDGINQSIAFNDALSEVQDQFGALFREIGESVLPILSDQLIPWLQETAIPAIGRFSEMVITVVEAFAGLPPELQGAIGAIAGVVAAVGPALSILGRFAMLISPGGLIFVGITALVSGLAWLVSNWEWVWSQIQRFVSFISDTVTGFVESSMEAIRWYIDTVMDGWKWLFETIRDLAVAGFETLLGGWRSFGENVTGAVQRLVERVVEWFQELPGRVGEAISDMATGAMDRLRGMANTIVGNSIVPDMVDDVDSEFHRMEQQTLDHFEGTRTGSVDEMEAMNDETDDLSAEMADTIIGNLEPITDALPDFMQEGIKALGDELPGWLDDLGLDEMLGDFGMDLFGGGGGFDPASFVGGQVGDDVGDSGSGVASTAITAGGTALGVPAPVAAMMGQALGGHVEDAMESLGKDLLRGLGSMGEDLGRGLESVGRELWSGLGNVASGLVSGFRSVGGVIQSLGSNIMSGISSLTSTMASGLESLGSELVSGIESLGSELKDLLSGVAGGVGGIVGGISSAVSSVGSSLGFRHGGIVHGPVNALIGEDPRTAPEVVAPLDDLQEMIGGRGGVSISQTISGVTADEVERQTRRALRRESDRWGA